MIILYRSDFTSEVSASFNPFNDVVIAMGKAADYNEADKFEEVTIYTIRGEAE